MDAQYKSYGDDALLALAEFYEKGKYRNAVVDVDLNKATKYYEKYVNQNHDGDVYIQACQDASGSPELLKGHQVL